MSTRPRLLVAALGPLALVVAVVVGVLVLPESGDGAPSGSAAPGVATTAPLDLETVPSMVADHYLAAEANADTFGDIPCYCGCEAFLDHRNLYDCFVRADGAGWERHASGCGVCLAESASAQRLLAEGLGPAAIRRSVIAEFGSTPGTIPQP